MRAIYLFLLSLCCGFRSLSQHDDSTRVGNYRRQDAEWQIRDTTTQIHPGGREWMFKDTVTVNALIARAKHVGLTDSSEGDKIFRVAISKAKASGDFFSAGKAYYEMGEMYFRYKNHNKSFGAFFNAKENFVSAAARKEIAYTNFALGRQQYYRGNYKLSAAHLTYAMREARLLKLKKLESDILEYLGILYHVMPGAGATAAQPLMQAIEIKNKIHDSTGSLNTMQLLAGIFYDEHKYDSALYFSNRALGLAQRLKLVYNIDLIQLQRIPILLRLHQHQEARSILQSISNTLDTANLNLRIRYSIQSGNCHVATGDTASGERAYKIALKTAQNAGFSDMYSLVYKSMADAYFHVGDFKRAYECQLSYNNMMAGLYSADNFRPVNDLRYILNTNHTENKVKYLHSENKLKQQLLQNERSSKVALVLCALGFLVSAMIILLLYRKQQRKGKIIQQQSAEMQTLMKEIHHRVKNNLQVIASLLDLQSQTMNEGDASEAIRESRNRVHTMALIHQDLYGETNSKGVVMVDYIHRLVASLFSSYKVQPNKVVLQTDIVPMTLDIDVVVPIGFVLNELISNALKYAFISKESGILTISLRPDNGELILKVTDNGVGFPDNVNVYHAKSFGYKLVKAFAQKLKARLEVFNDNGASVVLRIRKCKIDSST